MHFPIKSGILIDREIGRVRAVDGVSLTVKAGRDAGPGRGVRLRQVHPVPRDPPAARADVGLGALRRQGDRRAEAPRDAAAAARDADDLPGPLRVAEPAPPGGTDRRRPAAAPRPRLGRGAEAERQRAARAGRARPRALQPLPARVLGRAAPADRDRPGARAAAAADHRRRAGLGARRLDPGADHQPARGPPGRVQADLHLRRPRPRGDPPRLRPDRGHVPRARSSRSARPTRSTPTRSTPTRSPCSRPSRSPIRG